jgi:Tfp pilus assembly protein PilF
MKEAECHYEWSADVADQYVIFALDAYGRDSKSLYNAGVFYARRDEYEQARTYFEEALAIDPEHRPSLEAIARLEGMGH